MDENTQGDSEASSERLSTSESEQELSTEDAIPIAPTVEEESAEEEDDEDEEEEEEEEAKLDYRRLTPSLGPVYRNGDAVSTVLVSGDKMIIGTHNGIVHVLSLPSLHPLRVYQAHSASVTCISVSPSLYALAHLPPSKPERSASPSTSGNPPQRSKKPPAVPNSPTNNIHISTCSIDGHVTTVHLLQARDVFKQNFSRPLSAVALSPKYARDRVYLAGGRAGILIKSVAHDTGNANPVPASASSGQSSGWLNAIGLGGTYKDYIVQQGQGPIGSVSWSLGGKLVTWSNEQRISIMRSHVEAGTAGQGAGTVEWKRLSIIDRPDSISEELAAVWPVRFNWSLSTNTGTAEKSSNEGVAPEKETLTIGWGGIVWVADVFIGREGVKRRFAPGESGIAEEFVGWAVIRHRLLIPGIISGITLYTPSILLYLSYSEATTAEQAPPPTPKESSSGFHDRKKASLPVLRMHSFDDPDDDIVNDELIFSRYESLSATDYHLAVLPPVPALTAAQSAQDAGLFGDMFGTGSIWAAGLNATTIFSSAASVASDHGSNDHLKVERAPSFSGTAESNKSDGGQSYFGSFRGLPKYMPFIKQTPSKSDATDVSDSPETVSGNRIYILSPYDCILARERTMLDHAEWLLKNEKYAEAWGVIDEHPEIINPKSVRHIPDEIQRQVISEEDDDDSKSNTTATGAKTPTGKPELNIYSAAEKEKRRIGQLWVQKLIDAGNWSSAGAVCGKVLGTSSLWEKWVWIFAEAGHLPDISPFIPTTQLSPPLPSIIYEMVLADYLKNDRPAFSRIIHTWPLELYDSDSLIKAVEAKAKSQTTNSEDWTLLRGCLAYLYMEKHNYQDALRQYLFLRDADMVHKLLAEHHLMEVVADDIPNLFVLRVDQIKMARGELTLEEIEKQSEPLVTLLIQESHHGIVSPQKVISQLDKAAKPIFLHLYLKEVWKGEQTGEFSKSALEGYGDLCVSNFAQYDRILLNEVLRSESIPYSYDKAVKVCDQHGFFEELVYLLSKTGQTKQALYLIIDRLGDVQLAINFTASQNDPDLWNDLMSYSLDKPSFIRGLLEHVGAATGTVINPITLIRKIPDGLKIEGLKGALIGILHEFGVQRDIHEGAANVVRSELATSMQTMRNGQLRGVKFGVGPGSSSKARSGMCAICSEPFDETDKRSLVGFACGHIYHLPCLIYGHKPTEAEQQEDDTATDSSVFGSSDSDDINAYIVNNARRTVGWKVTHAALIKEKIKGCKICQQAAEAADL